MRMRRYVIVTLLALTVIGGGALGWRFVTRGVRVTVINNGPDPISELVVHVTGNTHRIGNLAVGESRTVRVAPETDSGAELTFKDAQGQPHRQNAGGYFSQHDRGRIEVELENGEIKRNDHDYGLSLLF
jgi:hypothetical protein